MKTITSTNGKEVEPLARVKIDTGSMQVIEPDSNEKDDTHAVPTEPKGANLENLEKETTTTKKGREGVARESDPTINKIIEAKCTDSEVPTPLDHHPLGKVLSKNISKNMREETRSSLPRVRSGA